MSAVTWATLGYREDFAMWAIESLHAANVDPDDAAFGARMVARAQVYATLATIAPPRPQERLELPDPTETVMK